MPCNNLPVASVCIKIQLGSDNWWIESFFYVFLLGKEAFSKHYHAKDPNWLLFSFFLFFARSDFCPLSAALSGLFWVSFLKDKLTDADFHGVQSGKGSRGSWPVYKVESFLSEVIL